MVIYGAQPGLSAHVDFVAIAKTLKSYTTYYFYFKKQLTCLISS